MRLVDLHCDWLRQYATETTLYEGSLYPEMPTRVGRLDGYLLGASLAALACARQPLDWAKQSDPWGSLGLMLARYEAEFTGRIIRDAVDVARWRSSPSDGLCWGVIGVAGFDFLVRKAEDLERLPGLFERGVRVFQPVATSEGLLGGSTAPDDDRGLTDLGRSFLARVAELANGDESGRRPILDLAGMNAATLSDTLQWLDELVASGVKLMIAVSHGTSSYDAFLEASSPDFQNLQALRSRGCIVGLTPGRSGCETIDDFKRLIDLIADIPIEGRQGYEGIAIGSDLTGLDRTIPALASARELTRWLSQAFERRTCNAIAADNAREFLLRSAGVKGT
jgi:membrane dipeptidase